MKSISDSWSHLPKTDFAHSGYHFESSKQPAAQFDGKHKKPQYCSQILRYYSWVRSYVHNSHAFVDEPQSLISQNAVKNRTEICAEATRPWKIMNTRYQTQEIMYVWSGPTILSCVAAENQCKGTEYLKLKDKTTVVCRLNSNWSWLPEISAKQSWIKSVGTDCRVVNKSSRT